MGRLQRRYRQLRKSRTFGSWKRRYTAAKKWALRQPLLPAVLFGLAAALFVAALASFLLSRILDIGTEPVQPADLTTTVLTIVGGVGGVVFLVVAYRKQRDLESGRFVEHFGAAAEQLGHPDPAVRMAGVYAMAGVADQVRGLKRQQCIDVLCGYLRLPYTPGIGANHQHQLIIRRPSGDLRPEVEEHHSYRQNDRVVRQTIVSVISSHLESTADASWSKCGFDFHGVVFEDARFTGAYFAADTKFTSFIDAHFTGSTSFTEAHFAGRTSFTGAIFNGPTSFTGAIFAGDTWFTGTHFAGRTSFTDAVFTGHTSFSKAHFTGPFTEFWKAFFRGDTTFRNVDFGSSPVSFITDRVVRPPEFDWDHDPISKPANVELVLAKWRHPH